MARELVKVELFGENNSGKIKRFAIDDGASVSKGMILYLTDPRTASSAMLGASAVAGIAAEEHVAGKGITTIPVWTDGILEATASAAIVKGEWLQVDYLTANTVRPFAFSGSGSIDVAKSFAVVFARALEAATADEVINIQLMCI